MEWMIMPLRRYADFNGRSRRMEYWMFTLGYILLLLAIVMLSFGIGGLFGDPTGELGAGIMVTLIGITVLGLFIPSLAVQVRRMHDQDKSGWFILLGFIPYIGGLIMLVFMCIEGTQGPNQYGPDPKDPNWDADVFE